MAVVSSFFLVLSLTLAVVIGPQTRAWTWGPALLALGFSVAAALPLFWRKSRISWDFGTMAVGTLVAGWFAWRAWTSPVSELAEADLMLLAGVVGTFVSLRAIEGSHRAEQILSWGIALLLLANLLVIWKQVLDPSFSPIFGSRAAGFISGFYAHYNEAANYLIASSLLVAADGLFRKHAKLTRVVLLLISIGGIVAIYFTRSRGGILGIATGVGVFAIVALMIGQRTKAKWFVPAVIAVPLVGMLVCGFLYVGWKDSQALRMAKAGGVTGSGIEQMMDNNSRLYLLGFALSCVRLHPMAGGGSRSFSWESFQFADAKSQGDIITHLPEQVHNELVQAATDYGIIGATLIIVLLFTLVIMALARILFSGSGSTTGSRDAWRLGGVAALAGMFVQSSFSFVFHLLPGCVLLGICMGQLARTKDRPSNTAQAAGSRILISVAAIACAVFLIPIGWKGSQVTRILWPTYFSKQPLTSNESRIDALSEAISLWPQSSLYQERAFAYQKASSETEGPEAKEMADHAVADYEEAELLHPFDPNPAINRANVLSQLHRDREAEDAYDKAINLQGGMEPSFRARFSLAKHLMHKGIRLFNPEYPGDSLAALEIAGQQMEKAVTEMHWAIPDMTEARCSVQESLGAAREANGDYAGAMEAYDIASKLGGGKRANYRAGVLNGKLAARAWAARRSSEALWYFIEAKRRIRISEELPNGVTLSQRAGYLAYLDEAINYLKGAKIEPIAPK